MFTVKLYHIASPQPLRRIEQADSISLSDKLGGIKTLVLHRKDRDNEEYYIGISNGLLPKGIDDQKLYDRAIIENSTGRTTEIINAKIQVEAKLT